MESTICFCLALFCYVLYVFLFCFVLFRVRTAFSRDDTALLFHLKNHYALIFALREWTLPASNVYDAPATAPSISVSEQPIDAATTVPSTSLPSPTTTSSLFVDDLRCTVATAQSTQPVTVRQMLCARKGQRPTAWVDFDEARDTMLGWEGYKIMALTMKADHSIKSQVPMEQPSATKSVNPNVDTSDESTGHNEGDTNTPLTAASQDSEKIVFVVPNEIDAFNVQAQLQIQSDSHTLVISLMYDMGLLPSHY